MAQLSVQMAAHQVSGRPLAWFFLIRQCDLSGFIVCCLEGLRDAQNDGLAPEDFLLKVIHTTVLHVLC